MLSLYIAFILIQLNNLVNVDWPGFSDIDGFVLSDFDEHFNRLFDIPVNNDGFEVGLFSWDYKWNFSSFRHNAELFVDHNLSFSNNLWLDNSDCFLPDFLDFNNLIYCGFLLDLHLVWHMDLFVLDDSVFGLYSLFNKSVHYFGDLDNHQILMVNYEDFCLLHNFFNYVVDEYLNCIGLLYGYNFFDRNLNDFFLLDHSLSDHRHFFDDFNRMIHLVIDVVDLLDLDWPINVHYFLDNHLNSLHNRHFYYLLHYHFNSLRNFHYLFDDPWHHNNLLNCFFYLNYSRYFN